MAMDFTNRSNIVSNEIYWNDDYTVQTYSKKPPKLYWYEQSLVDLATQHFKARAEKVKLVHIIGCGSGRELPSIIETFPEARFIASDYSPRMVEACRVSLEKWGYGSIVSLRCCRASLLEPEIGPADLVVILNNVLTYVLPESERLKTCSAIRSVLRSQGLLIGVVHNRWGRLTKTAYFLLQRMVHGLRPTTQDLGDHICISKGVGIPYHYFTPAELRKLLTASGFVPLEIQSLASWARYTGKLYAPITGDNNLVFVAEVG